MYSIGSTTLIGLLKNPGGLWVKILAPTSGMTIDTTADTYAAGCECTNTGDGKVYTNSGTSAAPVWQDVNLIATAEINDAAVTPLKYYVNYDAAASAAGTGPTSTISDTATDVSASSGAGDANSIIVLPSNTVGRRVTIRTGATGMELRTSSPTTVSINGGTGSAGESALAANSLYKFECQTATKWIGSVYGSTGQVLAAEPSVN